jgi:hypothetical protein
MIHPAATPPPLPASQLAYGQTLPAMRAAELPAMVSIRPQELFPDIPSAIHNAGRDLAPVRQATRDALASVDMSMIRREDTVNVLCSEHGFAMMGGEAYAELIKSIRDEVVERTGCEKIWLAFSSAVSKFEGAEIIPRFGFDDHFCGQVFGFGPYDKGVPIDTKIGRLYGVARAYAADRLIHVHYDDPREIHWHRINGRALKAFTMSYARAETRSVYHNNFPTRSANIVPRAIYESPFVQERWGFSAMLRTSPAGTIGVDADNDLIALDRRVSASLLRNYGKMIRLLISIDECCSIADDTRWLPYQHAGGVCSCALYKGTHDHLDLDLVSLPKATNRAVKLLVLNHGWMLPGSTFRTTIAVGAQVGEALVRERHGAKGVIVADDLSQAMEIAVEQSGTDKAIAFDGCYAAINVTRPLAEELVANAPEIARQVDEELLPKWLRQRGLAA